MSASHKEIINILAAIQEAKVPLSQMALATVVDVEGSSYRRAGARMLILNNGTWTGSISGGCLEGNALRIARNVMLTQVPELITYDTRTDENARILGASLGCNGVIKVWIEPLQGEWVMVAIEALQLAFRGSSEKWYARMLEGVAEEIGRLFPLGELGDEREEWADGVSANFVAEEGLQRVVFAGRSSLFAVECIVPATRLLVFGGGEDVRPLVQIAAQMGWRVTVTDDCAAKALPVRFPEAERVVHLDRKLAVQSLGPDRFTAAVLMSHNYGYDKAIMSDLQAHWIPYVGMLGPRRRFERMDAEMNGALEDNPSIHAPIGLDIGAQTPYEIALAVVAEIQAVFANRAAGFLKHRAEAIHPRKVIAQ